MKSRYNPVFTQTITTTFNKTTGATSTSQTTPLGKYEQFTVMADVLNGDHVTVNGHEFRKLYVEDYHGYSYQESTSPNTWVRTDGYIHPLQYDNPGAAFNQSVLYNQALGEMYDDLRSGGAGKGLDLAIDIAEAGQVSKMFGQVTNLSNYVRSFTPKNWAKKWLEYQYGWKPLVSSVYGTFDAIMHRRTHSYGRWEGKSRDIFISQKNLFDASWAGSIQKIERLFKQRCKIVCEFEIKPSVKNDLLGYTSCNPVGIAWELVPYSFVADWIIDIGGYLRALEAALAYSQQFKRGFVVYGYKDVQVGRMYGSSGSVLTNNFRIGKASAVFRATYKLRSRITAYPLPRPPQFHPNLGWQRVVSAGSLLGLYLGKR